MRQTLLNFGTFRATRRGGIGEAFAGSASALRKMTQICSGLDVRSDDIAGADAVVVVVDLSNLTVSSGSVPFVYVCLVI